MLHESCGTVMQGMTCPDFNASKSQQVDSVRDWNDAECFVFRYARNNSYEERIHAVKPNMWAALGPIGSCKAVGWNHDR